jgi:hypothetical protein
MEQRRGSRSQRAEAVSAQQEAAAAAGPPDGAVAQLLTNACGNLAKLTSDSMQLFAADMSDVLKTYRCDTLESLHFVCLLLCQRSFRIQVPPQHAALIFVLHISGVAAAKNCLKFVVSK